MPRSRLADSLEISERQLRRDIAAYEQLREDAPPGQPLALPRLVTELRDGRAWVLLEPPDERTGELAAELCALALNGRRHDPDAVEIRLLFDASAAERVARRAWPGQLGWERALTPSGSERILRLRLPVCDELVAWILTWRDGCVAMDPPELRARLAAELRLLLDRYDRERGA